jgi:hypothetical protein
MIDIPTPASVRRKLIEQFEALALFKREANSKIVEMVLRPARMSA